MTFSLVVVGGFLYLDSGNGWLYFVVRFCLSGSMSSWMDFSGW